MLDILNNVQCVYTDAAGVQKRTLLRLSMHSMRGRRGNYIADKLRQLYADGCNLRVNYGLMGFHTKQHIGAPTARGRVPLRSTGFNLVDDPVSYTPDDEEVPENIERYTHHKYFVLKGSYKGVVDSNIVWTGSTNWSSLGTPQDEILFTMHGRQNVRDYLANFALMWREPYSRDAYTTTYSSWRTADGRVVAQADGDGGARRPARRRTHLGERLTEAAAPPAQPSCSAASSAGRRDSARPRTVSRSGPCSTTVLPLRSCASTVAPSWSHADQVPVPQSERSTSSAGVRSASASASALVPGSWSRTTSPVGAVNSMRHHCGSAV